MEWFLGFSVLILSVGLVLMTVLCRPNADALSKAISAVCKTNAELAARVQGSPEADSVSASVEALSSSLRCVSDRVVTPPHDQINRIDIEKGGPRPPSIPMDMSMNGVFGAGEPAGTGFDFARASYETDGGMGAD